MLRHARQKATCLRERLHIELVNALTNEVLEGDKWMAGMTLERVSGKKTVVRHHL